jgi:glycosyltransferase involved in cell wall biosynthesis
MARCLVANDVETMSDSIGVVIPLHNKRAYVRRAIESVLRQTHKDFKLTVVDDGSSDGSAECVEQISDPRIRLVRTVCRGPGAARNLGIRLTEADWIALIDADDEWRPTFLEKTVAAARLVPHVVAIFTAIQVRDTPVSRRATPAGLIEDYHAARMRFGIAMTSSSVLVRRAPMLCIGGFREDYRYAEDIEAWFRLSCEGPTYYIAEPLSEIELNDSRSTTRAANSIERAAGLQMLLDSYEAYRRAGRIPAQQARSCRRFMQHQRGRVALHLFNARQRAAGARVLLTGVPVGLHTWREYVRCAVLAFTRSPRLPPAPRN